MNRFFRSAFFPLIVIVLLVWLASQTLIPKHNNTRAGVTYSSLRQSIEQNPGDIQKIEFTPSKRGQSAGLSSSRLFRVASNRRSIPVA